jgi:hypothetical protein
MRVALAAWIIQDGNYDDFEPGDAEFALEFVPERLARLPSSPGGSYRASDSADLYAVNGSVVHCTERTWVIDVGVLAYSDVAPPPWVAEGVYFEGDLRLGVDHFTYFERLHERRGFPALIYSWRIDRIWVQTASAPPREVPRTDAWGPDLKDGSTTYLLDATPLTGPTRWFTKRTWR